MLPIHRSLFGITGGVADSLVFPEPVVQFSAENTIEHQTDIFEKKARTDLSASSHTPAIHTTPYGFYSRRIAKALWFALQGHRTQKRKGAQTPYFTHITETANIVLEMVHLEDFPNKDVELEKASSVLSPRTLLETVSIDALPQSYRLAMRPYYQEHRPRLVPAIEKGMVPITLEDVYIAALLHDMKEDQPEFGRRILKVFGPVVSWLVDWCTYDKHRWNEAQQGYNVSKRQYLEWVRDEGPRTAFLIVGCDKLENLIRMNREFRQNASGIWSIFKPTATGEQMGDREKRKLQYIRDIADVYQNATDKKLPMLALDLSYHMHRLQESITANKAYNLRLDATGSWFRRPKS